MTRTDIIVRNQFHHTEARARPEVYARLDWVELHLSRGQTRRLRDRLCGSTTCSCGGALGQRPTLAVEAPTIGAVHDVAQGEDGSVVLYAAGAP